jgi:hypothetical protein
MNFIVRPKVKHIKDAIDKLPPNGIFVFDDFISREKCDEIVNEIEKHAVRDESKFIPSTRVKCFAVEPGAQIALKCRKYIVDKLKRFSDMMTTTYSVVCDRSQLIQFRKIYGATKIHYDGHDENILRNLSVILALNDDYEGGELVFPLQEYEIKLKKGQLIAFPPYWTHPHYTNDLKNGTYRYTINTWFGQ